MHTELIIENKLSEKVIGCALQVHKTLGPGLLESSYKACLCHELIQNGIYIECEKPMPLVYKGIKMECGYRVDILVENKIIIEIKAVEVLNDIYLAQVLTYLKLSNCRLGLLMNFNVSLLKNGIRRIVL